MELGDFVKGKPREELEEIEVLIGTPENVMADIEENLDRAGICNHVRLDSTGMFAGVCRTFDEVLEQEYLYNYNIILAKRRVLEEYCAWLFPILFRAEEINDPKGRKLPDRFIGYLGENLETLYFNYHKDRLWITHTGCRFLV